MKRLLMGLITAAFLVSGNSFARIEYKEGEITEQKVKNQEQKELRKQQQQREREIEQATKKRLAQARREDRTMQHAKRDQEKREQAAAKAQTDAEYKAKCYREKCQREEFAEKCRVKKAAKKERCKERKCEEKKARVCKRQEMVKCRMRAVEERCEKRCTKRHDRFQKLCKWKHDQPARCQAECQSGMYADVYKSPAWPTSALFWEGAKDLFNVTFNYQYATDCYDSNRSGSKSDITRLEFGENPITVQDILLASKLVAAGKVVQNDPIAPVPVLPLTIAPSDVYLKYLANEVIRFNGRAEQYGLSFDLGRYIIHKDVAIGIEIPVLYKRHRLKMSSELSDAAIEPGGNINNGAFGLASLNVPTAPLSAVRVNAPTPNAFLRRYGADPVRFVQDALKAKGIHELGGSTTGLGDVAFFVNTQINSSWFEKAVLGFRAQFPTGKKASQNKLWAPSLGNGGFTEFTPFGAILLCYNQYVNPHILTQVTYSFPAHVDRRVPRKVEQAQVAVTDVNAANKALAAHVVAFGDRVNLVNNQTDSRLTTPGQTARSFSEFDSTVRGFGDTISTIKARKGAEFKFRIGNMFEHIFSCRGFFDVFYDFRAKQKDHVSESNDDARNANIFEERTNQLEHRIGCDYSYQFDLYARVRLGVRYTFAGRNVPKAFDAVGSFNYAF